ncbi:sugar phosphate isomerase/epimerase family protein [Inquilinus limosus]|uniref:sugar phosphate isomerase/epimerase family protein n=1 Tax=Inquilinus limosus TaxID=171674 RepID=UPI000404599B|nr:TIM barrel protein [Inquilinus limosus]
MTNNFPKLHNAAWPGIVGKGGESEPIIPLDTLLRLTAEAEVDGARFDGIDLFITDPHVSIDSDGDAVKRMADHIAGYGLKVGSFVAPIWGGAGGGSAMGSADDRRRFVTQVRKACVIGQQMRELGIRPTGGIRIDSSTGVEAWSQDPEGNTRLIAQTFRDAADIAEDHGEFLVAEGEICWGGMHSWREMVKLLELVDRPGVVGYQADMAHSMLYTLGTNAEQDRILPRDFDWSDHATLDAAYRKVADALRPWTMDFHVAQNDGTVFGSGDHEKTGRHCQVADPNGKLDIVKHAGYWLRDGDGHLTRRMRHICWDGCMFPNAVMEDQKTWNAVLGAMIKVRDAHGWRED